MTYQSIIHSQVLLQGRFSYTFTTVALKLSYQAPGKYYILKLMKKIKDCNNLTLFGLCDSHFHLFIANKQKIKESNKKKMLF